MWGARKGWRLGRWSGCLGGRCCYCYCLVSLGLDDSPWLGWVVAIRLVSGCRKWSCGYSNGGRTICEDWVSGWVCRFLNQRCSLLLGRDSS